MKKLLCTLALTAGLILPSAAAGELSQPTLDLSAQSAVLMEKETGTLLYQQQPHEKLEPASVTKIMTLLLIMEAIDSGQISQEDVVTVSANAAGMGGSQVYLKQGEQMTVGELIKCITVVSGNDASVAMAEYLAGSESAFVERMNQRAKDLGMEDTTFLNCTGLPQQGHMTTAYDIALMSRELIRNHPGIRAYTTIWMDSIRDGAFGLTNTNRLIRFYQGATGLKTGSTDSAQYCMSATAERDGMELIAVVMKCPSSADRQKDAQALLDYGFASYTLKPIYPETPLAPIPVALGEQEQIQPQMSQQPKLLIRKGQESQVTTRLTLPETLEAPVEQGQTVGQLEIFLDGAPVQTVPIVSAQSVERLTVPGVFTRLLRQLLMAG